MDEPEERIIGNVQGLGEEPEHDETLVTGTGRLITMNKGGA